MRPPAVSLLLLALAACGEKAPPQSAGSAVSAPATPSKVSGVPGDEASQAFAHRLMAADLKGFHPSDAAGGTITYSAMHFNANGTWNATGAVTIDDENMDCQESGTWSMDAARSATVGEVVWKLEKTNCAGRDAGVDNRAVITLEDGQPPQFQFR